MWTRDGSVFACGCVDFRSRSCREGWLLMPSQYRAIGFGGVNELCLFNYSSAVHAVGTANIAGGVGVIF